MKQLVGMTKGRRVFVMQCGFHAYMESWGLAMENPYYALTDQDGRFEIGDIPPGTYKMVIWHPVPRRHEGTDHHDPAEEPSEGGHKNPRAHRAPLCQRDGGQALYPVRHHRRCPEPASCRLNPSDSIVDCWRTLAIPREDGGSRTSDWRWVLLGEDLERRT